jgi:solute carrier family 25 protein 34/35
MYNQNTIKDPVTGRVRGALYTNPIDCLYKTFRAEGIAGWYKGQWCPLIFSLRERTS